MATQMFKAGEIEWAKQVLTVKMDDADLTDLLGEEIVVGETVRIKAEGPHNGKIGVVIHSAYGTVSVEPYNDPYWNDPRLLTKLGPYLYSQVEKVKRPKGASTEWKEPSKQANEETIDVVLDAGSDLRQKIGGAELLTPKAKRGRKPKGAPSVPAGKGAKAAKVNDSKGGKVVAKHAAILQQVLSKLGNGNVTRDRLVEVSNEVFGIPHKLAWVYKMDSAKVKRGLWSVAKIKSELGV